MKIEINKYSIPLVFVDTFAIIDFYKNSVGENTDERISELFSTLNGLVKEKKILCPLANQEEEIYDRIPATIGHYSRISSGLRFSSSESIKHEQYRHAFSQYQSDGDTYYLDFQDAFSDDIDERLKRDDKFIISVTMTQNDKKRVSEQRKTKNLNELHDFLSRAKVHSTYEEQLSDEQTGLFQAARYVFVKYWHNIANNLKPTVEEAIEYMGLFATPFEIWTQECPEKNTPHEFFEFLKSKRFFDIPVNDIYSRLIADIVFQRRKFDGGDYEDLTNISSYLPYCDYFITDKAQMNRIVRLGLDRKYRCNVYAMKNINELIDVLDGLSKSNFA